MYLRYLNKMWHFLIDIRNISFYVEMTKFTSSSGICTNLPTILMKPRTQFSRSKNLKGKSFRFRNWTTLYTMYPIIRCIKTISSAIFINKLCLNSLIKKYQHFRGYFWDCFLIFTNVGENKNHLSSALLNIS